MVNEYDTGDKVRLTAIFKDSTGGFIDPPIAHFLVKNPATTALSTETSTGANVTHPSTGNYQLIVDVPDPGSWTWRTFSTGTNAGAGEDWFRVIHSIVTT